MLQSVIYLIFVFSLLGIVFWVLKIFRMHFDKKLLNNISDNIKNELIRTPSYSLMNEEDKKTFKNLNIKSAFNICVFGLIISIAAFVLFFITSIAITGKGDTSLFAILLWISIPMVLIFVYFASKDILRASKFKKIYEIRAFIADTRITKGNSENASLVYYDYKKMQYCITSIPLSVGHVESSYPGAFCWAMAVDKGRLIKLFDISPRIYGK